MGPGQDGCSSFWLQLWRPRKSSCPHNDVGWANAHRWRCLVLGTAVPYTLTWKRLKVPAPSCSIQYGKGREGPRVPAMPLPHRVRSFMQKGKVRLMESHLRKVRCLLWEKGFWYNSWSRLYAFHFRETANLCAFESGHEGLALEEGKDPLPGGRYVARASPAFHIL